MNLNHSWRSSVTFSVVIFFPLPVISNSRSAISSYRLMVSNLALSHFELASTSYIKDYAALWHSFSCQKWYIWEDVHTLKHANRCIGYDPLPWHHNERDGVSNHWHLNCLLSCWFRCWSKKTSKLHVTGLCAGNSLVTVEFPAQKAIKAENVSTWWRHHAYHWTCKMLRSRIDWNERMPKEHVLFMLFFMYEIRYTSGIWSQYIKFSIAWISKFCIKCSCLKSKWYNVSCLSYLRGKCNLISWMFL